MQGLPGCKVWFCLPSVGVKDGLGCVIFRAIVARKTPNLALHSLQHSVQLIIPSIGTALSGAYFFSRGCVNAPDADAAVASLE